MLDANGYLAALTNPELETTGFSYTDDGLMLAKTDARQNSSTVTYDASIQPSNTLWKAG